VKAIRRYRFQDDYDWVGEECVAPVGSFVRKDGHSCYPASPTLTEAAEAQYRQLADKDIQRGLKQPEFVRELAESWNELNAGGSTISRNILFHSHDWSAPPKTRGASCLGQQSCGSFP
jgi:hypothetical protein